MYKLETRDLCTRETRSINNILMNHSARERLRVSYTSSNTSVVAIISGSHPREQLVKQVSLHKSHGELLEWLTGFKYGLNTGVAVPAKKPERTPMDAALAHVEIIELYIKRLGCFAATARKRHTLDWADVGSLGQLAKSLDETVEQYIGE